MLDNIPLDLLIEIVKHLAWKDIYALRQVNKYLYQTLLKNKKVRKTILREWRENPSNFRKTWKYRYYGQRIYRIMRWRFHTLVKREFIEKGNDKKKEGIIIKKDSRLYYNGVNTYPYFQCETFPLVVRERGNYKYVNFTRYGSILLNIIVKGDNLIKYNILANELVLLEEKFKNGKNIIWFNGFGGIPINDMLRFNNISIRIYSESNVMGPENNVDVFGTYTNLDFDNVDNFSIHSHICDLNLFWKKREYLSDWNVTYYLGSIGLGEP